MSTATNRQTTSPFFPVQFYTPESAAHVRNDPVETEYDSDDSDVLPTQFLNHPSRSPNRRSRRPTSSGGIPSVDQDARIQRPSHIIDPRTTFVSESNPVHKRKRQPSLPSHIQSPPRKRGRARCDTPPSTPESTRTVPGGNGGLDHRQGSPRLSLSGHAPVRPRRVLDAVETRVRRKTSRLGGDVEGHEQARASLHYPSPPTSCVGVHGSRSSSTRARSVVDGDCARGARLDPVDPVPTLPLKTSKYFTRASVGEAPGSPAVVVPVDESRFTAWWCGLYDDLMIMLRRLKPILVQETVRDDPWKVLIAVRLLNVTTGKAAIPVFCKIVSRWPTPRDLVHGGSHDYAMVLRGVIVKSLAPQGELVELLRPLGLYNKRAHWLREVSARFLEDGYLALQEGAACPGVGPYAIDSLRIFCADREDEWKVVMPHDKELVRYLRWRWAVEQGKMWYPKGKGVIGDADVPYLITLVDDLAAHYDDTIGGEGYMYHFCNDICDMLGGHRTGTQE